MIALSISSEASGEAESKASRRRPLECVPLCGENLIMSFGGYPFAGYLYTSEIHQDLIRSSDEADP